MNVGFLGVGNMGSAILKGFLSNGIKAKNIFIYDVNLEKTKDYENIFSINVCNDYEQLINKVDYLLIAVKPDILFNLLENIKPYLKEHKPIIISIVAGISMENISNKLNNKKIGIVRVMPNINAEICLSTSAYCYQNVDEKNIEKIKNLLEKIGSVFYVPENKFNIFTAIAGCSPAYIYLFLDSLAKGAQKMGINKKDAIQIAIDVVIGSANMLKQSNKHPWELIDNVCSPGGTTIEGICTLEKNNFQQTIVEAVENTIKKDILLNKVL